MAESPRLMFGSGSRPSSRGALSHASDATERPDSAGSTRTLSQEIDHIKYLIGRSKNAPKPSAGSITAQVFRQRSSSTPVSTAHIYHELDQLKKRIKTEQQHSLVRRPSQTDPETESEAEPDDLLDEREEELERAREEVIVVKQNGEQLLEAAERKVDSLSGEKENLEGSLNDYREELGRVGKENGVLEQRLREVQQHNEKSSSQAQSLQQALQEHATRIEQLQHEQGKRDAAHNETREQLSKLETVKAGMEAALAASSERVAMLEAEKIQAAEKAHGLVEEHRSNHDSLTQQLEQMQSRLSESIAETRRYQTSVADVQKKLEDSDALVIRLTEEHDARCAGLSSQIDEHKKSCADALEESNSHQQGYRRLQQDLERKNAEASGLAREAADYQAKVESAASENENLVKLHRQQLEDTQLDHQQALRDLKRKHDEEQRHIEQVLDQAKSTHAEELEVIKTSRAKDLYDIKSQQNSELDRLMSSHVEEVQGLKSAHATRLSSANESHNAELAMVREDHEKQLQAVDDELGEARRAAEDTAASHAREVEALRTAHSGHSQAASNDLDDMKRRLEQAEADASAKIAELKDLIATHVNTADTMRKGLAKKDEEHKERIRDLETKFEEHERQLTASRASFANLEAISTSQAESLRSELKSRNSDAERLQNELSQLRGHSGSRTASYEKRLSDLTNEVESKERQLIETKQVHNAALEELSNKHSQTLKELKSFHAAEIDQLHLDYKDAANTSGQSQVSKIAELNEYHQRALEQAKQDNDQTVQQLREAYARESTTVSNGHANEIERIRKEHDSILEQNQHQIEHLRREHDRRTEDLVAEHSAALGRTRDEYDEAHAVALAKVKGDSERRIQELNEMHSKQKQDLVADHSTALETAKEEAQGQHDEHLVELQHRHDAEIAKVRSEHEQKAKEASILHEDALARAEADRSSLEAGYINALEDNRKQHETSITQMQEKHDEDLRSRVAEAQKQHEATVAAHNTRIQELHAEHDSTVLGLKDEISKAGETLAASQAGHELAAEQLQSAHSKEVESIKSTHEGELEERRYMQNTELNALRTALSQADERMASAKADNDAAVEAMRCTHSSAIQQERDEHSDSLRDVQSKHEDELKTVRDELMQAKEKLHTAHIQHDSTVENLHSTYREEMKRFKGAHDEDMRLQGSKYENQLQALQQEIEVARSSLEQEHEDRLSGLKFDHESHVKSITKIHLDETSRLQVQHESAVADLKAEHDRLLENAHQASSFSERQREDKHEAEFQKLRSSLGAAAAADLEAARVEHGQALDAAEARHRDAQQQAQNEHNSKIANISSEHEGKLEDLRTSLLASAMEQQTEHENALAESRAAATKELEELRAMHEEALAAVKANANDDRKKLHEEYESRLASVQEEKQSMRQVHDDTLNSRLVKAESQSQARIATLMTEHSQKLDEAESSRQIEAENLRQSHEKEVQDLRSALETQEALSGVAQSSHEKELNDKERMWTSKLDQLSADHKRAVTDLQSSHEETLAQKVKDLTSQHAEALAIVAAEAKSRAKDQATAAEQQYRASLEAAVERSRQNGQAEVRNLKKRHQDAVAHIRLSSQKQLAAQLSELEESHRKELQDSLDEAHLATERSIQEATESHQDEILRLETEHQSALAGLEARLQSDREAELASNKDAFTAEITALQSRLDASLTGQAEAERSLAVMRQQVSQAERRAAEASTASEDELVSLQKEKEDLESQLEKVQGSLRDLQSKYSSGTTTPRRQSTSAELANLKLRLDNMEEERATMRLTLQKGLDEKTELTRQNDFLIKELEALLAQRARPKAPKKNTSNALVQTDDFISEPKVDLASFQEIKNERRKSLRPVTPMSPGQRQAKDEIDMAWKTRSFEDYLQDAQAELSDLGSVITANEKLFEKKIREHVGELQKAKDQLAADYKSKLDRLASDKEQMEKMVNTTQAAAFARDRRDLMAQYEADFDDPREQAAMLSGLPVGKAKALRTAEQRLVQDYNQRIAKRKSQIALKHAEEYQSITQEYDRKIAELLNNKYRLEGDLSVDPAQFEDDFGELHSRSEQLEAEREQGAHGGPQAVRSRKPMPTWEDYARADQRPRTSGERRSLIQRTSHPRNSTSIPRSSMQGRRRSPSPPVPRLFYPGNRDGPDATSQPFRGRERYTPVQQRSLMRAKEPSDAYPHPQQRIVSEPSPPKRPMSQRTNRTTKHDSPSMIEKAATHSPRRPIERDSSSKESTSKPGFLRRVKDRISLDGHRPHMPHFHRPGSASGRPGSRSSNHFLHRLEPTPEPESQEPAPQPAIPSGPAFMKPKRSRSKKLSSGMIYYQAPRQKSPALEFE